MATTCPDELFDFLGHGNLDAQCWFVGMEEGAHTHILPIEENIAVRLSHYGTTMDLQESQRLLRWPIAERSRLTHVWLWMAKILRGLDGELDWDDPASARRFVVEALGGARGNSFLAELLPLPSPSATEWPTAYHGWWPTRRAYESDLLPRRKRLLASAIRQRKPRRLVAYGCSDWDHYRELVEVDRWEKLGRLEVGSSRNGDTQVVLAPFFGNGAFGTSDAQLLIEHLRTA